MRLAYLSIALSPVLIPAMLPRDAHGAAYSTRAEVIWSSRDGQLHSRHSAAERPEVETGSEPTRGATDTEPPTWERSLVCEPFR